jgi:molybdenum cofactor cytidylyltransferase
LKGRIEGILLAAGESRRMGFPKALLKIDGRTFVAHTSTAMLAAVERLIIVIGAYADRVRAAIVPEARIAEVENRNYRQGQLSSIKTGLAAVSEDAAAVLIHLTDHPMTKPATFLRLVEEYERSAIPIVIARHDGRRGHPVLFARPLFRELIEAPENEGARAVVNADPARVAYVDVDDPGVLLDLDTPDDLARAGLPLPPPPRESPD